MSGKERLRDKFPRLFNLSGIDSSIEDMEKKKVSGDWQWDLSWRRERFRWKQDLELEFTTLVSAQWKIGSQDALVWIEDNLGTYTVKFGYRVLHKRVMSIT